MREGCEDEDSAEEVGAQRPRGKTINSEQGARESVQITRSPALKPPSSQSKAASNEQDGRGTAVMSAQAKAQHQAAGVPMGGGGRGHCGQRAFYALTAAGDIRRFWNILTNIALPNTEGEG